MFTAKDVKDLRERTGCGMMDCKKALTESNGDMEKAVEYLREKGLAAAEKKASRVAAEGIVDAYVTADGTVGALIEVNSETDFVAGNDEFKEFVNLCAKAVIANNPADVDALLATKYDAENTVDDYLKKEVINSIGENISIRRFQVVEGLLSTYVHGGGTIGVIVTGETTGDEEVAKEVLKNLALQAAAMEPKYLDKDSVPAEAVEAEKEIILAQIKNDEKNANKPEAVLEKMVLGKIGKFYETNCLMEQEYVKGDKESVAKYVANTAKDLKVTGFIRLAKGEGIEKKEEDYAAEVAKLAGQA